jgi:hypothetical protein
MANGRTLNDDAHELVLNVESLGAEVDQIAEHVANDDLPEALAVLGLLHYPLDQLATSARALQKDLRDHGVSPSVLDKPGA